MGGSDTARGMSFQTASAMLHLVRMPVDFSNGSIFRIEGTDEAVDFEILDSAESPILLAQAKTRIEPGGWSAHELLPLINRWVKADPRGSAKLRFISDAPVNTSGHKLAQLANIAQASRDENEWFAKARDLAPKELTLRPEQYNLFQRLDIHTRMGPWVQILDQVRVEILRSSRTELDAETIDSIVNSLFVAMFEKASNANAASRIIGLDELSELLQVSRREQPTTSRRHTSARATMRGIIPETYAYGREQEIATIREGLTEVAEAPRKGFVVAGIGGIGKSTLAQQYITKHVNDYAFIWWIPASSRLQVFSAYRDLVSETITAGSMNESELASCVGKELSKYYGKALLVFDGISEIQEIPSLLPSGFTGHYILTTRDSAVTARYPGLSLGPMAREDALGWYTEKLSDFPKDQLIRLIDVLEAIPLAMAQALAYLGATGCGVDYYVSELGRYRLKLMNDPDTVPLSYDQGTTLVAAIMLSLDSLTQRSTGGAGDDPADYAIQILCRCSLLAPREIPLSLAALGIEDESAIYNGIREARKYSLVNIDRGYLSIHAIVQETVRSLSFRERLQEILEAFQFILTEEIAKASQHREWQYISLLTDHAVYVIDNVLGLMKPSINTCALIANAAGSVAKLHGNLQLAETMLKSGLQILSTISSAEAPYRRAATAVLLAEILYNMRLHDEAISYATFARAEIEGLAEPRLAEPLLQSYMIEVAANFALENLAPCMKAMSKANQLLSEHVVSPRLGLESLLRIAQILVWRNNWPSARYNLNNISKLYAEELSADADLIRHFQSMRAAVEIMSGKVEDGLQIQAGISLPDPELPIMIKIQHADDLTEIAKALTLQSLERSHAESASSDWLLGIAEHILNTARRILEGHEDRAMETVAVIIFRKANVHFAEFQKSDDEDALDRAIEMAGSAVSQFQHPACQLSALRDTATELLEILKHVKVAGQSVLTEERYDHFGTDGVAPERFHISETRSDEPKVTEISWTEVPHGLEAIGLEARTILLGARVLQYHMAGESRLWAMFGCQALSKALGHFGFTARLIPSCLHIFDSQMREIDALELCGDRDFESSPAWLMTRHFVLWFEDIERVLDPLPEFSAHQFHSAIPPTLFRTPVILPGVHIDDLDSRLRVFSRGDYAMGYHHFRDREDELQGILDSAWISEFVELVEVLKRDISRALARIQ
ncbi:NB-ARC domain-containing protein [Nonomuraea solani]|uniref:NB-ARC domain-containing protein n=1 Tax=Nonomuraea solani TaxID=1144553 RepID=A0A1H6C3K4_9ACTN|nr:NB-ARC domain-containing protein [Nonomuraea solani]SEG67541.1 NB-ARC domain-containing protein [Nonomuraea solani]